MPVGGITVTGTAELRSDLEAVADKVTDPRDGLAAVGRQAVQDLKARAPRRSGRLAASAEAHQTEGALEVTVGRGVVYAGPIVYGWPARNIEANPFVDDTADRLDAIAHDEIRDDIRRTIQTRGLS